MKTVAIMLISIYVCINEDFPFSQSCWSIFLNQGFAAKGETKEGLMFMRKAQKLDPDTKVRVHRSKYYFT